MKHFSMILVLCQAVSAWAQSTDATLDKMIAAGKTPRELAEHLFDAHGCKTCHTAGKDGRLGFTEKGQKRAEGFDGCISTLKAMTVVAKVPANVRSTTQRQRAQRFEEFGCATCHKVADGEVGLTPVGTKLANLHLGCVDVEKLLAGKPAGQ